MPVNSRVFIGSFDFDLIDVGKTIPGTRRRRIPHSVQDEATGPKGQVNFTMQDWVAGLATVEEGLDYHQKPKYISATMSSGGAADAAFPGQILCQPSATTVSVGSGPALGSILAQVDFTASGGSINTFLIENQRYQHKLSGANTWTQAVDLGSGQTGKDGIAHGGKVAIGYGSGGQVYSADGVTFTVATANKADAYGALGANLYRAVRPNTVFAASAVDGAWDSGTTVADSSFNINSIVGLEQILAIGKEDGIYSFDNGGVVTPFTPELRTQANANFASIQASESFNGDYFFRSLNGVISLAGGDGTKRRMGLDQLASPDFPTVVVKALAHDDRYLYALCQNTSNNLVILRRGVSGAWHVFYSDTSAGTKQGQHIAVSAAFGYPALFFSYYDGASVYTTKFIRLATFPNPIQDTNYTYDTSLPCRIRMPRFGTAQAQMTLDQIIIQSRQCTGNITITPYYSADGGAITQFGATAVTSNPFTTVNLTTAVACNFIDLYFDLSTNSAATSPVLVGFSLKGVFRPNHRRIHQFNFTTQRGHRARAGARNVGPTETAANLGTLLATNSYQTVIDERGKSFSGLVHDVNRATVEIDESEEPFEIIQATVWESPSATVLPTTSYGTAIYG